MPLKFRMGSLENCIADSVPCKREPFVGEGATIIHFTDRIAATITEVRMERGMRLVTVQEDTAIRVDENGMCENQTYRYEPNPKGEIRTFSLRKDGVYREREPGCGRGGSVLRIGERDHYFDFSF